jgi:3',5'-cyclic AMP phosphodiesterase CpdA
VSQLFAQISDPHLSTPQGASRLDLCNKRALGYLSWHRKRRFEHRREVLQALQQDLEQFDLDQLLVTGDLTHVGLPQEFQQAQAWLRQLGEPGHIALVPGNHDACVAADWDQTFALWQQYMASDEAAVGTAGAEGLFPSLRVRGDIAFIGISTACPKPPLMATGTVGAAQMQRLPALLQAAARQNLFRVVHLHHCPLPGVEKWRKRLTDAPQLQEMLVEHGAELIVHGHGHRAHYKELTTRQGMAPVIAVPSASALGLHGADPAQYNCYRVTRTDGGWHLEVLVRGYQPATGNFAAGGELSLDLQRGGSPQSSGVQPDN